jgi:hypothetical protein
VIYLCKNYISQLKSINMKPLTTISSLLFILFLFSAETTSAQIQVRIGVPRPRVVVIERPPCPGHDYVWVEGHYVYDSYTRRDIWIAGQWEYVEPRYESRREERHHGHGRGHDKYKGRDRFEKRYRD